MTSKTRSNQKRHQLHQRSSSNPTPSGADATVPTQARRAGEQGEDVPLSAMLTGQVGAIQDLRGGRGFVGRLASLGFTPGAHVEMLQNYGHGPLIVEVRDARIALGRGEAGKVWVRLNRVSGTGEEDRAEG